MVTYIGDVPVQAIEEFSPDNSSKTQNVYKGMFRRPIVRAGSNEAEPFDLTGTTYAEGTKNEDDFIEDLKGLIREAAYNRINLGNRVGFLAVKDVKSKKTAELANMREYSMSGYFQPAAQYEASVRIETEAFADEWAKGIVPVIPLPVGATNVRVKSPWGSVTLPNPSGSMTGADGAVPVYQPFPVFDWRTYGCALAGATPAAAVFDAAVYAGKKITLTHFADETITWSFVVGKDVPQGKYKIGFRVEDGASAGAFTVTVTGSTTGAILTAEAHTTVASAGAWEQIQTAELSLLTSETITVVVAKATNDNVFSVNYGYLIPQNTCRVTFDAANEYNTGECKVYDTVTTGAAIASWKRVYNETHIFSGDIVVQNSFLRWTIKQATAWSTATTLTELVSNTTGTLYPIAFGTDLTDLVIDKILPNCIVLKARMDVGAAATYDSLNDVETAEIYITPAAFYFDLSRIGSFRYDWHCSLSSALYGRGSAFVDKAGAEGVQSSPYYMLGVAGAVLGMEKCTTDNANVGGTVLDTASTAVSEAGDYALSLFMVPVALNYSGSGFTISQDNNGVERKFFKDNFSNNTSAAYTTISGWVWDTANKRLYNRSANTGYMTRVVSAGYGVFSSVITHQDTTAGTYTYFQVTLPDGNTARMTVFWDVATVICEYNSVNAGSISGVTAGTARLFSIEVTATSIIYSVTGGTGSPKTYAVLVAALTSATIGMRHFSGTAGKLTYFSDLTYTPSIAFTDPFTSDTKTRYMRLSSTDVTTWVASAEGDVVVTGGKMTLASADDKGVAAILRSYNFGSGEYEFAFNNINDGGGGADTISCMFATQDIGNYLRITLEDNAAGSEILKVFYVTGLTATELATKDVSATYVRGNKTWIKVHYSSETGTIWVYLRDDAGAYPATPDLIVYKSLYPYGKVGFRATVTTAGAGNLNVAFYPATIRAALLVGETNVPATETGFYFRDEFTVDSSGRYLINAGTWAVTGGYYKLTAACGGAQLPFKMSTSSTLDQSVTVTMATTNENKWCSFNFLQDVFVAAVNYPVSGYDVTVGQNGGAKIIYLQRFTAGSGTNIATATLTAGEFPDAGESHIIRVTVTSAGLITVYFDGVSKISITDTTYTSGYSAIGGYQATLGSMDYRFDNLTISGTRYYMAPILRGAQIGRALIGGVDTPCTFFGDDCNWDTSGEWTARASCSWVADTANGWYTLTRNTTTGDAYVDLNSIGVTDHKTFGVDVYLGTATVLSVNFNISGKLYYIEIDATRVRYMGAGQIVSYTTTVGLTTWYRLFIDTSTTGTTKVYWDGVLIISSTTQNSTIAATLTTLYCYGAATKYSRFRNLQINALESTSTNGVTVCIPSPAHGGRFDITEYAKKALVAGTGIQPGIYKMLTRKISTVASASNDYETDNLFQNATDAATVSLETASLSEKAVNTTAWTEDREFVRVAAADAGDSIEFGVQRRQATSLSSDGAPATYVDVMQLVPMYRSEGVGALFGVGDLAFATAQYPCYIRRVEQKNIV